ncbi:MAG: hypothetical protein HN377_02605 [Alphaproteobacteria bacterium]|jgi:hypothetical protein|nr:hypothetical protein [Alphaproteobacteria bacterium]
MVRLTSLKKAIFGVVGSLALVSCVTAPTPSLAQQGTDIPVIVMGEDSDPMSVARTSDIFRRVVSQIQEQMSRYDFYVIDEEILAVEMGWQVRARRPKTELIQVVQLANQSRDPRLQARAMVVFKIRAAAQNVGFATKAMVRITGDIFDYQARRFIGSWEAPRMEFPAPANCTGMCIQEVVGDHARDVAGQVGDVLRKKLAYLTRGAGRPMAQAAPAATTGAAAPAAAPMGGACPASVNSGLASTFAIVLRNFTTREYLEIKNVMETEFPCFITTRNPSGDTSKRIYGYVSNASASKIEEWINILLIDMGLDPDSQVKVTVFGTEIQLDKIFGSSPQTPGRTPRFQ